MPVRVYLRTPRDPVERFWSRVDRESGPIPDEDVYPGIGRCWIMDGAGSRSAVRYRNFTLDGVQRYGHVVAYIITTGHEPPIETPCVTHLCDNGDIGCVRPSHLKADTKAGNMRGQGLRLRRGKIVKQAYADHAQWPQYAGHWTGAEWRLVEFYQQIETKLGIAFKPNDVTIAKAPYFIGSGWTAYSLRNKIDTGILGGFRILEY